MEPVIAQYLHEVRVKDLERDAALYHDLPRQARVARRPRLVAQVLALLGVA